jgi:hypothetical protein
MRFLAYIVGFYTSCPHALRLIVEKLEKDAAQRFNFVSSTVRLKLTWITEIPIFSFLNSDMIIYTGLT